MAEPDDQDGEPPRLFGDARSPLVVRGADRRLEPDANVPESLSSRRRLRQIEASSAVRLGSGDIVATLLAAFAILTFVATIIGGILILYNAKTVGAFSNPWDSTRVAIGVAVLAVGLVHSALLLGVSRAISYLLANLRLRALDIEVQTGERQAAAADRERRNN